MLINFSRGTIQGSILGPILYEICVSPLFNVANLTNFADENFTLKWSININDLIQNIERGLEMIKKWLKDSGLVVNEEKPTFASS